MRVAAEYGVGLIGSDEIEQLVQLVATPDMTVAKVLQRLSPHQTIPDLIFGTAGRVTPLG